MIVRGIGAGAGPTGLNVQVLPFDKRPDFDPAKMTPGKIVWYAKRIFATIYGSWDVSDHPCSIDAQSRALYLKPYGDPEYYPGGGGDHDIHVKITDSAGRPLAGAGLAFTSDGVGNLMPPNATVTRRDTEAPHGWGSLPIWAPSYPPDNLGPWAVTKLSEVSAADVIHGIGMWNGHHTSVFIHYEAIPWSEIQPGYATLADALHGEAQRHQVIHFNPGAALQAAADAAGFGINSEEFDLEFDGVRYRAQRSEKLRAEADGRVRVRVHYCRMDDWGRVMYEEWFANSRV